MKWLILLAIWLLTLGVWVGLMVGVALLFSPSPDWFYAFDAIGSTLWGAGWGFYLTVRALDP